MPAQALVVAQLLTARSSGGQFCSRDLTDMFTSLGLPAPSSASNAIAALARRDWVRRGSAKATWRLTPLGRAQVDELLSDMDLAALEAEAAAERSPTLGLASHTVIPPSLAPPGLLPGLRRFLGDHAFERNVFGMTRFPLPEVDADPVGLVLTTIRDVCRHHGLELHLASDRAIDDDLWTNVAGHMWACRYGVAIFEDRMEKGLNYNLTIEVGSMLMTGRRCALLKDVSIERMPSDLVGRIYKDVNLDDPATVVEAVESWISEDLSIQ